MVNGTMAVSNTSFTFNGGNNNNNSEIQVNSGGHLTASNSTFGWDNFVLSSNTIDSIQADIIATRLSISSGASLTILGNDFSNGTVVASGDPNATIDFSNNYWGTSNLTQIRAKITDHSTNANLPTVLVQFVCHRGAGFDCGACL